MRLTLDAARALDSFWVPEAPKFPGYYALERPSGDGVFRPMEYGTRNIDEALKFASRDECQAWCATQALSWAPVEHGYARPA